jgi:hypothetical protein
MIVARQEGKAARQEGKRRILLALQPFCLQPFCLQHFSLSAFLPFLSAFLPSCHPALPYV